MGTIKGSEQLSRRKATLACLPLEIQQHIYSLLDVDSFCAVRRVSSWFRSATLDSVTLWGQLRKLPIYPSIDITQIDCAGLDRLLADAANTLTLGLRWSREPDVERPLPLGRVCQASALNSGSRMRISPIDVYQLSKNLKSSRPYQTILPDGVSDETPQDDRRMTDVPNKTDCIMALSSSGVALAVASENIVQVYDRVEQSLCCVVCRKLHGAAGDRISGLQFEQNDNLLKVNLGTNGRVIYLGTPTVNNDQPMPKATTDPWYCRSSMQHIFLDSSTLKTKTTDGAIDCSKRLVGVQILRRLGDGYIFAAQKHGETKSSSHYILGHFRYAAPLSSTEGVPSVRIDGVVELARLESQLSCWSHLLNCHFSDHSLGSSENMPSAHEQHPSFALSRDCALLAVAEKDMKSVKSRPVTQIFVYHLPSKSSMLATLSAKRSTQTMEQSYKEEDPTQMKDTGCGAQRQHRPLQQATLGVPGHVVARIPLCLSTFVGEVTDLRFACAADIDQYEYMLTVTTVDTIRSWKLRWC